MGSMHGGGPPRSANNPLPIGPGATLAEPFGAMQVADLHPIVQRKWVSGINSQADETVGHDGGTVTANTDGELSLSTSTTTSSIAQYRSRKIIGYRTGQGVIARFTAQFTAGVAGTTQWIGVGDEEDGLFVGYSGETFGFLRRTGGQIEVRTLTITGASSGGGIVTVTLNGGAVQTTLSGALSIAAVAAEVAASDYSTAGGGWRVRQMGNQVVFFAIGTETRGGSYSFVDTGTTGATATGPAQTLAASAADDSDFTAISSWSIDQADGTGALPTLDPTKGNVYEITYQWLGYGAIVLKVEKPSTGVLIPAHRIEYANANTTPSLRQPDLPLFVEANNGATSSDIVVQTPSMGGFKAGEPTRATDVRWSIDNAKATDTTRLNVIVIRNVATFNSVTNRVRATIDLLELGNNSSNRTSKFHVTLDPDLVGAPSWTAVDSDSVIEYDTATTAIKAGSGRRLGSFVIGAADGRGVALDEPKEIVLEPGQILCVSAALASGGTSATQEASLNWSESI